MVHTPLSFVCRCVFATPLLALLFLAGCGQEEPAPAPASPYGYGYGTAPITFLAEAKANATADDGLSDVAFTNLMGEETKVRDFLGERRVVLIVTRGNTDPICPYCSTQTAHYIRDYDSFKQRNTEVLLVYPVAEEQDRAKLDGFLGNVRTILNDPDRMVPFPVLFDVALTAVDRLGIRKDLSKPATYVIDREGKVRYAYVGASWADRPSTEAMLAQLDQLDSDGGGAKAGAEAASPPAAAAAPSTRDPS